jgi:hypothetical protein
MTENISSEKLILKIVKWRKVFIIVSIITFIVTGTIVFLLPKQYKSTAIVFPMRQFSVSKLLTEQNFGNQEDYMQIGDADDAEKLIQVLTSDILKIKVANAFNLWERWNIKDTVFAFHYLKLKWEDMIAIRRTEFNSIKIEAHDYTANGAAQIANGISDYCDTVRFEMSREVAKSALNIVKDEYAHTLKMMSELEDSLQVLRNLGVLDYKSDVEAYTKSYAKAIEKGNKTAQAELEKKLDVLRKYGGAYMLVNENLKKYRFKYPVLKAKYDDALVNYKSNLPFKFVVEKAKPNEYKARPKRLLILGFVLIANNFIALFFLLLKEKFKTLFKN